MLRAKAKTRQLLCGSSGDQKTPTSQVWRAGGYELIRQRHFDHIHREDDKTCSHPSHLGAPNYRTYKQAEAMLCINLGQVAATGVPMKPPKAYKSWSQLEKAPRYVFILQIFNFNVTVLLEGWRK